MTHSRANKQKLLAWITHAIEHGEPLPTDAQVADEYGFRSTELARTLLADLADEGKLTVRTTGGVREITLGRRAPGAIQAARPLPTPGKRAIAADDPEVDAIVAKIAGIVGRPVTPSPAPAPAPAPAPPPPEPASLPVTTAPERAEKRKTLGAMVTPAVFEQVKEMAAQRNVATGRFAAELLDVALAGPPAGATIAPEPAGKPKLRAAVLRAAREDPRPFDEFVTALIDLGLESYLEFRGLGRAAA
ncbi:hypothetical protein [Sphingomonas solaris]|uniref:Uncharacterized protein n=1 Tax=Alterirhizorhabdus solaris TaxID=2529389 RepID=A0A558R866_9SPHN|nr:hypothetical protein [Sphingomonas solaris]TVV75567.1 hypothetical protein FOY91_06820 [Sphingomonas solaris]